MSNQVTPYRKWCQDNGISTTTAWRLVKEKKIKIVKIRSKNYILNSEAERFVKSLEQRSAA